jgi:hypothetical protein
MHFSDGYSARGVQCGYLKITGGSNVRVESIRGMAIQVGDGLSIINAAVETVGQVYANSVTLIDHSVVNIMSPVCAIFVRGKITIIDSCCVFVGKDDEGIYVEEGLEMDGSIVYAYSQNYIGVRVMHSPVYIGKGLYRFATNARDYDLEALNTFTGHLTVDGANIETCSPGGDGIYTWKLTMNSGLIRPRNSMDFKKDFFVSRELLDAYGLLISWNSMGIELGYDPEKILGVFLGETLVNWLQAESIDNPKGMARYSINAPITLNSGTIISDETEYGIYGDYYRGDDDGDGIVHIVRGGSLQGPIWPTPCYDAYGTQLACVTNVIASGTAYERVTGGWTAPLLDEYGTSSLYLDGEKKLYFWVSPDIGFYKPDEWSSSFFVTSDPNGTKPMSTIKQGDTVYLKYGFKNHAGNAAMTGFFNSFT